MRRLLLGGLLFVACSSPHPPSDGSPSRRTAADLPECRKSRMLCDEARSGGSAGMREFCLRAARDCREAMDRADSTQTPSDTVHTAR